MRLRSNGRLFHSFGAAGTKARSPRGGRVLKLGFATVVTLLVMPLIVHRLVAQEIAAPWHARISQQKPVPNYTGKK